MGHWHGNHASAVSAFVTFRKVISAVQVFAAALLLYCGLSAFDAADAQPACPAGATLAGSMCTQPPICPVGLDLSIGVPEGCCPPGQIAASGDCWLPGPQGTGTVEGSSIPPTCPSGWTLQPQVLPRAPPPRGQPAPQTGPAVCLQPPTCPAGTILIDGLCLERRPLPEICPIGQKRLSDGTCCVFSQVTSRGTCCPTGQRPQADGSCKFVPIRQPELQTPAPVEGIPVPIPNPPAPSCPPGQQQQPNGTCCPPGTTSSAEGFCCPNGQLAATGMCCPPGVSPQPNGFCAPLRPGPRCPRGQRTPSGACCPVGTIPLRNNSCALPSPLGVGPPRPRRGPVFSPHPVQHGGSIFRPRPSRRGPPASTHPQPRKNLLERPHISHPPTKPAPPGRINRVSIGEMS